MMSVPTITPRPFRSPAGAPSLLPGRRRLLGSLSASWLVALVILGAVPNVHGHGVISPLPVEHHLLQDEAEDAFLVVDGYDLYDLRVRETYWPDHGSGITFRFTLYGGFGPESQAQSQHIELALTAPAGPWAGSVTTNDDLTWTGDGVVVVTQDVAPDVSGYTTQIEAFVTYDQLGAQIGDDVSDPAMRSYVDDDLVDVAPGGLYPHGVPVEVPTESLVLNQTVTLQGAGGYTITEPEVSDDGLVMLHVKNAFADSGQHVRLDIDDTSGWTYERIGLAKAPLGAGNGTTFTLNVSTSGPGPLGLTVGTDLGGAESWYVRATAAGWNLTQDPDAPHGVAPTASAEAPLGLAPIALVLVGWAVAAGRRRAT